MTDLEYIEQEAAATTLSGVQMVKRYGADTDRWPAGHWRNLLDRVKQLAGTPPPPPPPPPPSGMPRQGISSPEFIGRSTADQDWELDRVKELGNGHPMFFRFDWWPNMASQFAAVKLKMEARGIVPMPLLNYDPGNRPNAATFAAQAAMCAQTFGWVNLLNEPNLGGWSPQDAAIYVKQAYAAIGGKAKVLAPDVATNGGHPPAGVVAWVQAYMAAGGKQDVAAVNLYTDAEQLDPAWNLWAEVPALRKAFGPVPLVSLEGGCRVDGQTYGTKWGQLSGVQYQDKSVATGMAARAAGTIDSYLVYSVLNTFKSAAGGFGLVDSSRVKRPAYGTFQQHAA